jgi:Cu+-exporting ATPase
MQQDNKVLLQVEGMDCANCAQTISRSLEKTGFDKVNVNFISGEVSFEILGQGTVEIAVEKIEDLGYHVSRRSDTLETGTVHSVPGHPLSSSTLKKFIWSAIFTFPLLLHMFLPQAILHNAFFQLILCLPVMFIGWSHFGKSAWHSTRAGLPNMDVLISIGSTAAFIYSLAGMIMHGSKPDVHRYLFFETAASIITLVLLGNLIEQRSVRQTTSAIRSLSKLQAGTAKKIVTTGGKEEILETSITGIRPGDLLQVNTGDRIPVDGKLIKGKASVNESFITGESMPVFREEGDQLIGSTIVESGSFRMSAEKVGNDTTLARIIELVKNAQQSKPDIQKLGDRISAIFVPVVIGISIITFLTCYFIFNIVVEKAIMNAIAVLVVSCPCAMGLATPTAVMVGLGRAAKQGILIKGGQTLENFSHIKNVVFDKTGTLTTGRFRIKEIHVIEGDIQRIRNILYSLELHSSHPVAVSLREELKDLVGSSSVIKWKEISEDKGIGINATDFEGNLYSAGSFRMVQHFYKDSSHSLYVLENNNLIAWVDLADEIKKGAAETIRELKKSGMRVIMISGDREKICEQVAKETGIDEYYSEQLPSMKLDRISALSKETPTAMVGDGINDAPALAKADIGISLSDATHIAIQSAQVVLLGQHDLSILLKAMKIGRTTYQTIKQNLFWAFFYNVLTIPVAAAGFLNPMIGALSMAFSDLVVIGNSVRLKYRKIN